ncbi:MAG: hypothetical protein KME05_23540 [Gloeocapsa sp. UFS-A4-WI-NPMV-4B04]|jgi:hypothetical protein|nr:hypothetical protein [Gloeocapsa sp. UFS-A4-WI-NPMV-4B04]
MAFLKVSDTVINTDHIVAVELDRISIGGKCCVVISVAANSGLFKRKPREFWFDGDAAAKLRDYFENPDNVTELSPSSSPRSQARERIRQRQRIRHRRSLTQPEDAIYEDEYSENVWDDEWPDSPDQPPPRPNIGRRPWKPQPPDPLSTAASVESFNPPIP